MGIVVNQSIKNTVITYLGFGIGAINVVFLYTKFLSDDYFGLITFILSTANILMPLMAFGTHNTIIKFFSSFKTRQSCYRELASKRKSNHQRLQLVNLHFGYCFCLF